MAKTTISVELDLDDNDSVSKAEVKVKSLKQQLKEMKELLASGTLGKDEFEAVARAAGHLQDQIQDVNQRVQNLASDSQKLDGFIDVSQGIVGGFAAVQGITALVGEENEDLQKTMVKLQAAMSALSGIQAIANTLNKDSAALIALQTVRTTVLTAAQTAYTFVVGTSTGAMKAFRIALAASGIGLIVIALISAAEAMGVFGDATDKTTEAIEKQNEAIEKQANKFKEGDQAYLDSKIQEIEIEKARLKLNGASNSEILKQDLKVLETKKSLLKLQAKDAIGNQELLKKAMDAYHANTNALILKDLEIKQAQQDEADAKKELNEKKHQERLAKIHKDAMDFDERDRKARMDQEQEDQEDRAAKIELEKKQAEERQAFINQQRDAGIALRQAIRERDLKEQEEERKSFEESWAAKTSIAESGYSILNTLGELALGEQFKQTAAGKILALAQIATDTALAFVSGLRIAQQSAQGTGPAAAFAFPVFYASQAAAILSVAAKAKGILSGGGSAGAGVPSIGGGGSQPPRLDRFTPQGSTKQDEDRRFYVLEKDITTTTKRVGRIKENAEII